MYIQVKVIKILEDCDGGGDASGTVGSGDIGSGWVPGIYNYKSFTKKRKKRKKRRKHNESATGGNGGAITGGEVYSIGVNPGTKPTPRATGDLVLSPVTTSPNNSDGVYGVPTKLLKKKKRRGASVSSSKDDKKLRVLDYQGYLKNKMNVITRLKK